MDDIPEYRSITFLQGYRVKATQLIDEKNNIYRQIYHGKPDEAFLVEMKNGRYDGEGILRKDNVVRMIYTFSSKTVENKVLVFNAQGEIIFNGYEKNNLKTGLCIEYEHGDVRFIGMYKNGMRNGYGCSFNENGAVAFRGRWKGDAETEITCDEEFFLNTIKPQTIESEYINNKPVYPCSGEFILVILILFLLSFFLIIIAIITDSTQVQTIKLSNGCIWNGEVKQDTPFGSGLYYHSNGTLYYSGQCWNGYFHGNGTMYHPDGHTKQYEGMWEYDSFVYGNWYTEEGTLKYEGYFKNSLPHGVGSSYQNGTKVFEGIWYYGNDYRGLYYDKDEVFFEKQKQSFTDVLVVNTMSDLSQCSYKIRKIVIHDHTFNAPSDTEINIEKCMNVEGLYIGNESGQYVIRFIIANLSKLKHVVIGSSSFTQLKYSDSEVNKDLSRIADERRSFVISNCTSLELLSIGYRSFSDYYLFQLTDLPSLLTLYIGKFSQSREGSPSSYNFIYAKSFVIESLPHLSSITLGNGVASLSQKQVFRNLTALTSLAVGYNACGLKVSTSLELIDLPLLKSWRLLDGSYKYCTTLTLKNLPSLEFNNIRNYEVFSSLKTLYYSDNVHSNVIKALDNLNVKYEKQLVL